MTTIINVAAIRLPKIDIDHFAITKGTWLGIVGPADSGKTALLLALMGRKLDRVSFDRQTDLEIADIGFVPSNPALLFSGMKSDLRGELYLSSQFLGRSPDNVDEIVHRFQIAELLKRDPFSLSGGEMARAALAIVAAKKPVVWLLDQVYDWLHPDAAVEVRKLIESELALGHAVVEAHSSSPPWVDRFDTTLFLDEGGKAVVGNYLAVARQIQNRNLLSETSRLSMYLEKDLGLRIDPHHEVAAIIDALRPLVARDERRTVGLTTEAQTVVEMARLSFQYPQGHFALGPIDLNLGQGEIVAVAGPNGSGKTTFLQCVANLLDPIYGDLEILGARRTKRRWEWPRRAFYCFQNPDDQLYLPTVSEEVEKTLEVLERPRPADMAARYEAFGLTPYLAREPYQLARPIRRMVCLAAGLISATPVILLDEPTSGLDVQARTAVREEIIRMAEKGFTFLMVSHDFSFIAETATRILTFSNGKIIADGRVTPWPLDHIPPLVEIGLGLKVEARRYSDFVRLAQHETPTSKTAQSDLMPPQKEAKTSKI